MTVQLSMQIEFHGPFRVATGRAREGVGITVDRDDLVPAASLKGVMRASARRLLPGHQDLVNDIFGQPQGTGPRRGSPWHWGPVQFAGPPDIEPRARIAIDPETHTARPDFLVRGDEVWARTATFALRQHRQLAEATRDRHVTVLMAAAAGVHSLGADRRRGLGWVTLRPVDPPLDEARLTALDTLAADTTDAGGGSCG